MFPTDAFPQDWRNNPRFRVYPNPDGGLPGAATQAWDIWERPPGVNLVFILAMGGGSGGGGGRTGATATNRGGGGPGGNGAGNRIIIPAMLLPEKIRIYCGDSGAGGSSGVNGSAGGQTYVCAQGGFSSQHDYIAIAAGAPTGGVAGTNNGTNAGSGTSGAIQADNQSSNIPGTNGVTWPIAGTNQFGAGSGVSTPSNVSFGNNCFAAAGGGGGSGVGNNNAAGGGVNAAGPHPGIVGGAANGGQGQDGFSTWNLRDGRQHANLVSMYLALYACGGAGGGSSGAGTGGRGGHGWYSCGGGGGGGGITGGLGGNGGRGLVIIACA